MIVIAISVVRRLSQSASRADSSPSASSSRPGLTSAKIATTGKTRKATATAAAASANSPKPERSLITTTASSRRQEARGAQLGGAAAVKQPLQVAVRQRGLGAVAEDRRRVGDVRLQPVRDRERPHRAARRPRVGCVGEAGVGGAVDDLGEDRADLGLF